MAAPRNGLTSALESGANFTLYRGHARFTSPQAVEIAASGCAATPEALHQPGFGFHALRGRPRRYSIHVNGPWCITSKGAMTGAAAGGRRVKTPSSG